MPRIMNNNLKNLIIRFGFLFMPLLVLCSCEEDIVEPQYDVRIVVDTDSIFSQVYLYGVLDGDMCLPMCHHFDRVLPRTRTDSYLYKFAAYCEDPETLIKIKVYVNDEYSGEVEGHSRVYIKRFLDSTDVITKM